MVFRCMLMSFKGGTNTGTNSESAKSLLEDMSPCPGGCNEAVFASHTQHHVAAAGDSCKRLKNDPLSYLNAESTSAQHFNMGCMSRLNEFNLPCSWFHSLRTGGDTTIYGSSASSYMPAVAGAPEPHQICIDRTSRLQKHSV